MLSENQGPVPRQMGMLNPGLNQETLNVEPLVRDPVTITQNDG